MAQDDVEVLARERGPALVGYAYLLTGELAGAQDLVQEALVRTFSRRRSGTDVEWLEAYVRRAILNIYLDGYRSARRWSSRGHEPQRPDPAPDAIAADRADIHAALRRLTPRERACIVLRHYEDLTVPEIAARLGLQEGSVKRYLADARKRLGSLLGDPERTHVEIITNERSGR